MAQVANNPEALLAYIQHNLETDAPDDMIRAGLRAYVDYEWKRQGQERDPVVYDFKRFTSPLDAHLVKVCYSVSDPTFGMDRPFIQHTINLQSGGLFGGSYDLDSHRIED